MGSRCLLQMGMLTLSEVHVVAGRQGRFQGSLCEMHDLGPLRGGVAWTSQAATLNRPSRHEQKRTPNEPLARCGRAWRCWGAVVQIRRGGHVPQVARPAHLGRVLRVALHRALLQRELQRGGTLLRDMGVWAGWRCRVPLTTCWLRPCACARCLFRTRAPSVARCRLTCTTTTSWPTSRRPSGSP